MRVGGLDALQQAADGQALRQPRLRRRRRAAQGAGRPPAVPEGLPRRRVRHARRPGRDHGQRQGGDGADGPVGAAVAGRVARPARRASATSSASSRSRRVDGGKGTARPTCSAAATASRVGKDAPPKTVDFLKFLLTRRQPAQGRRRPARSCRWSRAPRTRSRTRTCKVVARDRRHGDRLPALPRPGVPAGRRPAGQRQRRRAGRRQGDARSRSPRTSPRSPRASSMSAARRPRPEDRGAGT